MKQFDKDPIRDYVSPRRTPILAIAALVVIVVIGFGAFVAFGSGGGDNDEPDLKTSDRQAQQQGPDVAPTQPPAVPTAEPTPLPEPTPIPEPTAVPQLTAMGAGDRLSIPKFGINAPLTYKTVGSSGQMPDPDGND